MRLLAAGFLIAITAQPSTGRVTGVATDSSESRIPGASVTLRSAAGDWTVVSGSDGTFTFDGVPPGRYAVVAALNGMYVEPATNVVVSAGRTATVKIQLESDCMKVAEGLDRGLAWAAQQADLIAHIRIASSESPTACALESHCTCTMHPAVVLRTLKGTARKDLRFIQEGAGYTGPEPAYKAGEELVVFLRWDEKNQALTRIAEARYSFPVRNGRLSNGLTVDEFEGTLRNPPPLPSGDLIGTALDPSNSVLPGVIVYAHSGAGYVSTVTDGAGRFAFRELPADQYTIWTQLQGFEAASTKAVVRANDVTRLSVTLKAQCLHEVVYVDPGFQRAVRDSDVIAHVRVLGRATGPECRAQGFCTCTPHEATVLRQLKPAPREASTIIRLMQEGAGDGGAESVYRQGDEFIALLKRDTNGGGYSRVVGRLYMFRVTNGRVTLNGRQDMPGFVEGMTVDEFYQILTRF